MCFVLSQENCQDRWGCVDSFSFCKRFMIRDRWPSAVISRSFFRRLLSRLSRHSPSTAFSLKISVNLPRLSLVSHWHTSSTVQLVMFAGFSLEREEVGSAAVCVCVCVCVCVTERETDEDSVLLWTHLQFTDSLLPIVEDFALLLKTTGGEGFSSGITMSFTSSLSREESKGIIVSPVSKPTASQKCWGEEDRRGEGKKQVNENSLSWSHQGEKAMSPLQQTQENKMGEVSLGFRNRHQHIVSFPDHIFHSRSQEVCLTCVHWKSICSHNCKADKPWDCIVWLRD